MKRRLQILALFATALMAVRMMAQDAGGGAGGGGGGDAGGAPASGNEGAPAGEGGGDNMNGGGSNGVTPEPGSEPSPAPGAGETNPMPGGAGASPTPGPFDLFGPPPGESQPGTPAPSPSPPPEEPSPTPAASPSPAPSAAPSPTSQVPQEQAPVTLTLPGGYGGSASTVFTLGEGRLAKPPITLSISVSQGYDDNIFSAPSHISATPTPAPGPTPPLEERVVGFRISPPSPPTPVLQTFRPKALPTPGIKTAPPLGVVGSALSTLSLGVQIQKGTPRTVITADGNFGADDYWNRPGNKIDYNGSADLNLVERLAPRATFTISMAAVYQNTPNFSLVNAPTNAGNGGGSYVNGNFKTDLSYDWTARLATVLSYNLDFNLLETNKTNNLYGATYGIQFRYSVSPRATVTAEYRETAIDYPSNAASNTTGEYYLLGLDAFISARLRNVFSAGIQTNNFASGAGSQSLPYFESDTTLSFPRGSGLTWTNSYGYQGNGSPNSTTKSYRTSLGYSQPLSAKLSASLSVAFNSVQTASTIKGGAGDTQKQFQASASLGYVVSPRFSLSLSYTYLDLLSSIINSSYTRDQVSLAGSYTFQ